MDRNAGVCYNSFEIGRRLRNSSGRGEYVYSHSVVSDKSVELFEFDVQFD